VHGLPLKLPGSLELKLTVPVGVPGVPASVSVTVAVHVEACPTSTLLGEQLTLVDVERRATTVKNVKPMPTMLPSCFASPLYWAVIVCDPVPTALGV
jgi:hypothetical protein